MEITVSPTDALLELAIVALEHGVRSVLDGDGPLVPFVMIADRGGERSLERYDMNPVHALELLRERVPRDETAMLYAFAADGFLTQDDERCPAILVHSGQRGEPAAFVFGQRFEPHTTPKFSVLRGAPETLAANANWFAVTSRSSGG